MFDKFLTIFKKKRPEAKISWNSFEIQKVWVASIAFNPLQNKSLEVKFLETDIKEMSVSDTGIQILTTAIYRKYESARDTEYYRGNLGEFVRFWDHLVGIFTTKEDAVEATNQLISKWIKDLITIKPCNAEAIRVLKIKKQSLMYKLNKLDKDIRNDVLEYIETAFVSTCIDSNSTNDNNIQMQN